MQERPLRIEELELIRSLLSRLSPGGELTKTLPQSLVSDMNDGAMGSIRFVASQPRSIGKQLIEARYVDSDGVLVTIALNVDTNGRLFELDFWKVDFAPLRKYPRPENLISPD